MKGGTILGRGAEGCVLALNDTEVAKVLFVTPWWKKRGISNADFMRLQSKIRSLDPEEDFFIATKRFVIAPLETLPIEMQTSIQSCWNRFS